MPIGQGHTWPALHGLETNYITVDALFALFCVLSL